MTKEIRNYGKSVRDRLLNLSKEEGMPFMTVLVRYLQHPLFDAAFFENEKRQTQWRAFLRNIRWKEEIKLEKVGSIIVENMRPYWQMLSEKNLQI